MAFLKQNCMRNLRVNFQGNAIKLQGRALWDTDTELLSSLRESLNQMKEIHIDIEYMSCAFLRALCRMLSWAGDSEIYWYTNDNADCSTDLPVLLSEVLNKPIRLVPDNHMALA